MTHATVHPLPTSAPALPGLVAGLDPVQVTYLGFLSRHHGKTLELYRRYLDRYLAWCISHELDALADIKRVHVELYVRHLLTECGMKASTVNTAMSPVKGFYKFAVIDEAILRNPAEYVMLPKVHYDKPALVSFRDRHLFFETAKATSARHWALVMLLSGMALRISEAASLRVESYLPNIEQGVHIMRFTQKGGDQAAMPVPMPVLHALDQCRQGRTTGPVIAARDGSPLTRGGASGLISTVNRRAKLVGLSRTINPHLLRKIGITEALESGLSLREAQTLARHVDPRTTSIYDLGRSNHFQHPAHQVSARLVV